MPTRRGTWSPGSWAKSGKRRQPLFWSLRCGKLKHGTPCYWHCSSKSPSWYPRERVWYNQPTQSTAQAYSPSEPRGVSPGKVLCTENFSAVFKNIACLMELGKVRQDVRLTVQKMGWLVYWMGHWSHFHDFWRCHKHGKFPRRPFPPRMSAQIPVLIQIGNLLCTWACWWTTNRLTPNGVKTLKKRVPWKTATTSLLHHMGCLSGYKPHWVPGRQSRSDSCRSDSQSSGPTGPDKAI